MTMTKHDVLCQCGWGQLAIEEKDIPELCPVCGFDFKATDEMTIRLTETEKSWTFHQAKVRLQLGLMSVAHWREYLEQWEAKHGPYEAWKGDRAITKTQRRGQRL
jgi:hypothetical protein